ncbi:30S ribosomal protein S3ae [Haloferax sp. Atlit-10N]|uniref:30S ribosomal protein S3ae n=1 Tax=Haloferax TaxID=2251 RepID=UPI000679162F|nr:MULTISPECIES: 30S ribosomal protein S3ae [Haloferax]RDZ45841.1 30S ribosomal protein S3ae [Haloferax sp. Atlit-19N]RDZ46886.1 30S ribosomal protein S3ae [Haloferax sp. Atlit-16N]RDZ60718.1 30S ribosomal protein S3ae [Haloferax sp. Atlit-10N]
MSERSVSKQKRGKRWYTVIAPENFDRKELGSTFADEPEKINGRTVESTLGELNDDQGANNVKLTFKITDVGSDAAYTEFIQQELTRDYLRSLVRRGASKIEANVTAITKDDYRVQLQPVAFTTKKADRSQEHEIRRIMTELTREAITGHTYDALTESVVEGRLSSAIYGDAKVIYPLRRVEVKKFSLEARPEEVEAEEEAAVSVDEDDVAVDVDEEETEA